MAKLKSTIYRKTFIKKREPERVGEIINRALKKMGISEKIKQNMAIVVWKRAVGGKIAQKTEAVKIKEGVLFVKTTSAAWSQELSAMKSQLIEKVNKHLDDAPIKDIRFRQK